MGRVYLPTWMVDFYGKCSWIYHTWILWEIQTYQTLKKQNTQKTYIIHKPQVATKITQHHWKPLEPATAPLFENFLGRSFVTPQKARLGKCFIKNWLKFFHGRFWIPRLFFSIRTKEWNRLRSHDFLHLGVKCQVMAKTLVVRLKKHLMIPKYIILPLKLSENDLRRLDLPKP